MAEENEIKLTSKLELVDNEADAELDQKVCPECGMVGTIMRVGHCETCLVCGWSLCAL